MGAPSVAHAAIVDVRPGTTLGRYELLVPIAVGGMARVWAARLLGQGGFSKLVALKMILPDYANDVDFRQMFMDEARIAANLRHPNACETFDLGEHDGLLYLAMEWVDGPSLLRLMRVEPADPTASGHGTTRRVIPPRVAARIVADACAGLHAAHELVDADGTPLGVVHRDMSPHNILVSRGGDVKVTDFGVAKAAGQSHATITGQIKGKVSYMAPEQIRNLATLDRRSDVFSLGCVLYEVTTGNKPFRGDNDGVIVTKILLGELTPPRHVDPTYPSELERILLRAVALDPSQRFATTDELRFALERYLVASGPPVSRSTLVALVDERAGQEIARRREQSGRLALRCAGRPRRPARSAASFLPAP